MRLIGESYSGGTLEIICPLCGYMEYHRSMNFGRKSFTTPPYSGEWVGVIALCTKERSGKGALIMVQIPTN